ncbi:MAG: M16 family metallopeptidase [Thermocrispum sp.]
MTDFGCTVLPSGLRVVTETMTGVRSASVGIWVGVGSRDEEPAQAGAAHYLEHLLFKGTSGRTAWQIAEQIDAVGGELNAFTSRERTCFYAHVLDTDLPLAVDLVTDVVFDGQCAESDTETERTVVLDEIAMREDDPDDQLHELYTVALMGDHPLARPILGTEKSITGMTGAALRAFHRSTYRPSNMVLAAAGNVRHEDVVRLVSAAAGPYLPGNSREPEPPRAGHAEFTPAGEVLLHSDDVEQARVMLGMPVMDRHDARRFALTVLNTALGGGTSSRLFQEVRERRGLAYQVYSSPVFYADAGNLAVDAGCQPERLGELVRVLREVLADVAANGVTAAEVARAKGQLRGELVLRLEDTGSRMSRIGKNELNFGRSFTVDESLARIAGVTPEDVAVVARTFLRRVRAAAVVGPYSHVDELPGELLEAL